MTLVYQDFERCYRALATRDRRFDGMFVTGVTSTGIYCRPSCPAIVPKRRNVVFFPTPAAAQEQGLRACKRCQPDAGPGSPQWDLLADVAGRAIRLIADGVVDRHGVGGLASRLHLSERHLHRILVTELGAGARALARAHRAQTARVLIETTDLAFSEAAFAAGFSSIRQFNESVRAVFAATPSELRGKRSAAAVTAGEIELRLPYRAPLQADALFSFLGERAVAGIEAFDGAAYTRTLALPHSVGIVSLTPSEDAIRCVLRLDDVRDLPAAVQRCRRLLDLDVDPVAVADLLSRDPALRPMVERRPGLRVPGATDGFELAVRAVLGQQISVQGARTIAGRLVASFGKPLTAPEGTLTHLFPTADAIAGADLTGIGVTGSRRRALSSLASGVASGELRIDPGADRDETRRGLLEPPGIGPWTAEYVALRALGDPDAFMPGDLGVRKALEKAGIDEDPMARAEAWRPWRGYAQQYLWTSLADAEAR